ncbi:MAG: hypothetical protein WBB28_28205 [Crinalium sp.]
MVTRFWLVISLQVAILANFFSLPTHAATKKTSNNLDVVVVEAAKNTSNKTDKSPNRGNGRRELYINRAPFTIQ